MKSIHEIAQELNELSKGYKVGNLQALRKQIKGLKRIPGHHIFSDTTISDNGWAFHFGGRREIQFNIGFEDEGVRYGLAFSLEPSQSLPDISILYPKVFALNSIIRETPNLFKKYKFWYWHNDSRSEILPVIEIPASIVEPHSFVFIGKIQKKDEYDPHSILSTFDDLLPVYLQIESNHAIFSAEPNKQICNFQLNPQIPNLVNSRPFSQKEKYIDIDVRHTLIQKELFEILKERYGAKNVGLEQHFLDNRIDAVAVSNGENIFYEVKVGSSAKSCIRQALGQIMEYAYWPGMRNAAKLVIVGECNTNDNESKYIKYLNQNFHLPIEYLAVKCKDHS